MVLLNLLHRHDYSCTFLDVRILHLGCHTYVISVLYSCRNIFNQSYLVIIFQKLFVTLNLYLYLYRICTRFHVFASQLMHVPFIFYIIYIHAYFFSKVKTLRKKFFTLSIKKENLTSMQKCRTVLSVRLFLHSLVNSRPKTYEPICMDWFVGPKP